MKYTETIKKYFTYLEDFKDVSAVSQLLNDPDVIAGKAGPDLQRTAKLNNKKINTSVMNATTMVSNMLTKLTQNLQKTAANVNKSTTTLPTKI